MSDLRSRWVTRLAASLSIQADRVPACCLSAAVLVATTMEQITARGCTVSRVLPGGGAFETLWSADIASSDGESIRVELDPVSAVAIASAVSARLTERILSKTLTLEEKALIDYSALRVADFLSRLSLLNGWAITALDGAREPRDGGAAIVTFAIGGVEGRARVSGLPGSGPEFEPLPVEQLDEPIRIAACLADCIVTTEDAERLVPGDALLLGATSLDRLPSVRLVSSGGWTLADASVTRHSESSISLKVCNWRVGAVTTGGVGQRRLSVELGDAVLAPGHGGLPGEIDLPAGPDAPVRIRCGRGAIAEGELVRADGEIAARITSPLVDTDFTEV